MRQQFKILSGKAKRSGRLQEVALFNEEGKPLESLGGIKRVKIPVTFDMPDILSGVEIYTPAEGDVLLKALSWMSVPEDWEGITPRVKVGTEDVPDEFMAGALTGDIDGGGYFEPIAFNNTTARLVAPILLKVHDGSDGDPELTAGSGEVVLIIATA